MRHGLLSQRFARRMRASPRDHAGRTDPQDLGSQNPASLPGHGSLASAPACTLQYLQTLQTLQALLLQHVLDARLAGHQVDERLAQTRNGGRRAQRRLPLLVLRLRMRTNAETKLLDSVSSQGRRGVCYGSSRGMSTPDRHSTRPWRAPQQRRRPRQRRRRAAGRASTSAPLDARNSAAGRLAAAQAINSGDWPCPRRAARVRRWVQFVYFP